MIEVLLFGGTTEGRVLAELLKEQNVPAMVCVATEYGESLLDAGGSLQVHAGGLSEDGMAALMEARQPRLVLDATHPYADGVSHAIAGACEKTGTPYHRVLRQATAEDGCVALRDMDEMVAWLAGHPGQVFSALGSKAAAQLCCVPGFETRLWLRILPTVRSVQDCLDAGFPAAHLICMQGPFSQELNEAMFRATNASILLTKESGAAGGFPEKVAAARSCGMTVAVLMRPTEYPGLTVEQWMQRIREGKL